MPENPPAGITRTELLGRPTVWRVSDLGVTQTPHDYPADLLGEILAKAIAIKESAAEKRHLNLRYIRGAHQHIPEVAELVHHPGRLAALSELAGVRLEPYPISVISTTITFMGASAEDGTVDWHADGVPVTEIIPLAMEDVEGGELTVFRGNYEEGMARLADGEEFTPAELAVFPHRVGHRTVAQLMRVLHRTAPMTRGYRVSLNLNLRSAERPYVDDNPLYYLAADNPTFDWVDEYLDDVRQRQLPAYLAAQEGDERR
ncbi:hypothetical protein [Saccharothrix obliqua]|uniref:hypothetical protein n=1 Tax=Saccharothrix obliqua TaxID=2861747 RepID=UPI001C5E9A47|nr:hypothetical protein [Saccharothrix obliqua]MBW4718610.1 hypothetical protein [Saccharothrix obliqua]